MYVVLREATFFKEKIIIFFNKRKPLCILLFSRATRYVCEKDVQNVAKLYIFASSVIFTKNYVLKVKSHPIGLNPPNPVTRLFRQLWNIMYCFKLLSISFRVTRLGEFSPLGVSVLFG
jgi:hypothetical protein